jgi:hypothetical protein
VGDTEIEPALTVWHSARKKTTNRFPRQIFIERLKTSQ